MRAQWPFCGRSTELATLADAMRAADGSRGVVIAGPAGVGKTRLATTALSQLMRRRSATAEVLATRATRDLPLAAFGPLLSSTPPRADRQTTLTAAADEVCALAPPGELTLLVDDAHLLDDVSAALVFQLAQENRAQLLLTYRTGELAPEPVRLLWERDLLDWLDLSPMSNREIELVLAAALGGQISSSAVERLCHASAGNMLLLRELVNACIQNGTLVRVDDVWLLRGPWPMAPRLVELVKARLGEVSAEEKRTLELLAYGEPARIALLDKLVAAETVRRLEERGLIVATDVVRDVQVRLAHPLYAEVLRAQCPTLRARQRRRELAAATEAQDDIQDSDRLRLTLWRLDAGIPVDADTLVTAGRYAWTVQDVPLAERLARTARAHNGGVAAAQLLAELLSSTDRPTEAEQVWAETEELPLSEQERAKHTSMRVWNLLMSMDRAEEALNVLDRNREKLQESYWRAELDATASLCLVRLGRLSDGLRLAETVVGQVHDNVHAREQALLAVGLGEAARGRYDRASAATREAVKIVDQIAIEAPWLVSQADRISCLAALHAGHLDLAERIARQRLSLAQARGTWDEEVAAWTATVGWVLRFRGQVADALRLLKEADAIRHDMITPLTLCTAELAHVAALSGEAALAERTLLRAQEERPLKRQLTRFWIAFARPWIAWVSGSHPSPAELALTDARDAASIGATGYEAILLHDAVRLGAATKAVNRLDELASLAGGRLVPLYARHARAVVNSDGTLLADLSSQFIELGSNLLAAEAALEASEVFHISGSRTDAAAMAQEARRLASACQGARTPILSRLKPGPATELTARERQIATLAAGGQSNKQIAERLTTSVRTIDNHLYRIYAKLGVRSRSALRAALEPGELP